MKIFDEYESNVRSYCRDYPIVFSKAKQCYLYDEYGERYLDFFSGAGTLNYGHNHDNIIAPIIEYLQNDGILHALDMYTTSKRQFMEDFNEWILKPRGLHYKFLFCGPTGTNAVEAAIKLARKAKKRASIFSFSGAYHGLSLGSLALTSSMSKREVAGVPLPGVVFMPFPFGFNNSFDTIQYIENILTDDHSGVERPAAIVLETIQAEGGVIIADIQWLQRIRRLCDEFDLLLICDEIQVGCGRTGDYFSFERAGIVPDMITVSKAISGCGLPLSLVLLKPELDVFTPGEHNGTFRGNQLAFVGASAAIGLMEDTGLLELVKEKGKLVTAYIQTHILEQYPELMHRGMGLIHGIDFSRSNSDTCQKVAADCFKHKLIIETSGRKQGVLKIIPPLVIETEQLVAGMQIIEQAIRGVLS